jgi:hypothetical protein
MYMKLTRMSRSLPLLVSTALCSALAAPGAFAQEPRPKPFLLTETTEVKPGNPAAKAPLPSKENILKKLNSIILPRVEFRESTVREAIEYLVKKSKELDPDGEGVNMVLKLEDAPVPQVAPVTPGIPGIPGNPAANPGAAPAAPNGVPETKITLSLNNVPLLEVIKYITNLANLKFRVEPFAVTILPIAAATDELLTKEWKVSAKIFQPQLPGNPGAPSALGGNLSAKDFLLERGVTFNPGAFAMYSRASSTLVVKNSEDQLDLVDRIVEASEFVDAKGNVIIPRVEFKDAAVSEAVDFLLAKVPDANILTQANVRAIPVTLSLRNVTLAQALQALQFTTGNQILVENSEENMFQLTRNADAASQAERPQVRIFSLATYLGGNKDERAQAEAIKYLEDALSSAVSMVHSADPGSDAQVPRLQVNRSTKLLIAVGRKSDLALVEQLAAAVEGNVMVVPGAGGGASMGGMSPGGNLRLTSPLPPAAGAVAPSVMPLPTPRNSTPRPPQALPGNTRVPAAPGANNTPPAANRGIALPPLVAPLSENNPEPVTTPPDLQRR